MRALVDVGGVGYEVQIPMSTFEKLPLPGAEVKLLTHLQVREDEHVLFGFATGEERDFFKLLVAHVSGVGPKVALAFLNGCSVDQLKQAVALNDTAFLSRIKGVGKKTAERVIVELRDKVGLKDGWAGSAVAGGAVSDGKTDVPTGIAAIRNDALLALLALGYKQPDALKALERVKEADSVEVMVREALRLM